MQNLNLLFNKTYYDSLTATSFPNAGEMNKRLFHTTFSHEDDYLQPGPMISNQFLLKVGYPGLLIGIGNSHDSGMDKKNNEIGVGFSFDYVTGQPYIPGSTVKGVLRTYFMDHPQVITELCKKDLSQVKQLETEIFENADVFFDAVVYDGDETGNLIGPEYITPHPSPLEDPVPIKLLKVLPGVRFSFRFRLTDGIIMPAAEKEKLFRQLLCMFGIGAKTNVGFGTLQEDETNGAIRPKRPASQAPAQTHSIHAREQRNSTGGNAISVPTSKAGRWTGDSYPNVQSRPVDRIKCPYCGIMNYKFKLDSTEQWSNWPICRNRDCRKALFE